MRELRKPLAARAGPERPAPGRHRRAGSADGEQRVPHGADQRAIGAAATTASIARATETIRAAAAPGLTPIKEAPGESKCRWELLELDTDGQDGAPIEYVAPAAAEYVRPLDLD